MVTRRTGVAVGAALLMALTACGGGGGSGEPADLTGKDVGAMPGYAAGQQFRATEPLTFPVLYSDHESYPVKDDWLLWQEITTRTNVTLEPSVVPRSDYEEKRSLVIGAGDAPPIIPKTYPNQVGPYVASGAILPVSDYVHLMPNFRDKVEKWGLQANLDAHRQADGKYYVLPGLHEEPWQDYSLAMRTDVLAQLGLHPPRTGDQVRDVLTAIKRAHPDSYPLSDREEGKILLNMAAVGFGTKAAWDYENAYWDADAGRFVFTGAMPQYRAMVEYFRSLVADGLLDPETFSRKDNDIAIQNLATGRSFAISSNAQMIVNDYRPALKGVPGATIEKVEFPEGPAGNLISAETRLENGIMISSKAVESPNFVAMMQFVDWLWYSDEGQELAKWGVEGVTYTKGPDGKRTLADGMQRTLDLQKKYGFSGGVFAYGGTTELLESTFSEEELRFQALMKKKDLRPVPPPHPFTADEREQATLWESALKDHVEQATSQFILGQRDLADWDAYVAELDGKGMTQYMDLVNAAHQRFVTGHG